MKKKIIARHQLIPVFVVAMPLFANCPKPLGSRYSLPPVPVASRGAAARFYGHETDLSHNLHHHIKKFHQVQVRFLLSFSKRRPLQRCVSMPQTDMLLIQSQLSDLWIVLLHMRNSEYSSNHLVPFPPRKVNRSAREGSA